MITIAPNTGSPAAPTPSAPRPDDAYLMMAAAQMHTEGRLIRSADDTMPPVPDHKQLLDDIRRRDPTYKPPSPPPEKYWPSNGRRDHPAMMT